MTVEDLNNLIPTLDDEDVEQLLMTFMGALEVIENKTFSDLIEEYDVEFAEKLHDKGIREKQIKLIYQMHSKIMNR